jgi:hypothetical protein
MIGNMNCALSWSTPAETSASGRDCAIHGSVGSAAA